MLRALKAMAILFGITVALIAMIVFGTFIGGLLLLLAAVFVVGGVLYFFWLAIIEYLKSND